MKERRHNWKDGLGKQARERKQQRLKLLTQLEETRAMIRACGLDFVRYDALKGKQREIVASLAVL
jgi:hypothetical protein